MRAYFKELSRGQGDVGGGGSIGNDVGGHDLFLIPCDLSKRIKRRDDLGVPIGFHGARSVDDSYKDCVRGLGRLYLGK